MFVVLDGIVEVVRYKIKPTKQTKQNSLDGSSDDANMLAKDDAASDSKSQAIQMIVLKKIGRGGVINLGGVIRNE